MHSLVEYLYTVFEMLSGEHLLVSTCFFKGNRKVSSGALGLPQLFKRGNNCPPLPVCKEWKYFWNYNTETKGLQLYNFFFSPPWRDHNSFAHFAGPEPSSLPGTVVGALSLLIPWLIPMLDRIVPCVIVLSLS